MFCGSQHINFGHLLSDLSLSMLWFRYSDECDYFENFYFLLLFDRLYKYHCSCVLSLNPTTLSKSLTILSSFFVGGGFFMYVIILSTRKTVYICLYSLHVFLISVSCLIVLDRISSSAEGRGILAFSP